ncbi:MULTISPECIES: CbtA family protein [Mycolicibacterium]|uniref:CbtA family protein n=3 Tax=Mycolicibacterium TaxID=1866885 RepID=A0ABT8H9G3_MYCAO|nr:MULTISPECIES: CbtA family protein [Mycolicibacterium]MDN4517393.1 CbtA family protein [Mycolicibacterium austroafricanum]
MEKQIIWRGLLAGAAAGVLAFGFARIFAAPQTARAIEYEDGVRAAREAMDSPGGHAGHGENVDLFTRTVQMNIGMGLGLLAFSVAIGALFAVVFAVAYGRVGDVSARLLSLYIAGGMLLSLYVVPNLKYPASPPALSLDQTVRERTLLYVLMVVLSGALLIGAVVLARRWVAKLGAFNGALAAAGAYATTMAIVMFALPTINETPAPLRDATGAIVYEGFPADVLYYFRLYALGTQVVIYTTIGLVLGAMMSRLVAERQKTSSELCRPIPRLGGHPALSPEPVSSGIQVSSGDRV